MSEPTAYYLYQRGLLHKENAEKLLANPGLNGPVLVNELLSMVKYLELGVAKQRKEARDESNI